ncbi:MAG: hypothetical protein V3U02_12250, partial [Calditrichia bacterium]
IRITPSVLGNWYLGDGGMCNNQIKLFTYAFRKRSVEKLIHTLKEQTDLRFIPAFNERKEIYISLNYADDVYKFLTMIKEFNMPCFGYKWDFDKSRLTYRTTLSKKKMNHLYWNRGMTLQQMGKTIGISCQTIQKYMKIFEIPRRPPGGVPKLSS